MGAPRFTAVVKVIDHELMKDYVSTYYITNLGLLHELMKFPRIQFTGVLREGIADAVDRVMRQLEAQWTPISDGSSCSASASR